MADEMGGLPEHVRVIERKIDELAVSVNHRFDRVDDAFLAQRSYTDLAYERLDSKMEAGFSRLEQKMDAGFAQVDGRFAQVEGRFAQIDGRFTQIDGRFARLERKMDQIIDHFVRKTPPERPDSQ